jgi:hypothetical protein
MAGTPLSHRTAALVTALFGPEERERAMAVIETQCGAHRLGLPGLGPVPLERYRFAALRASGGRLDGLERAVALAKTDWRDLLMEADFGHDVQAHERWCEEILAAESARARAARYNEQLDERLRRTGLVDARLFLDFAAVQDDPDASSVGWLHAKLCVLSSRLAAGAAVSLFEPSTGALREVADLDELAQWAERHFPIARFRP